MKSVILSFMILVIVVAASLAFRSRYGGGVRGTVSPANSGSIAWMISGTDTFKAEVKTNVFEFTNVKQGSYSLIVQGIPPYKNALKDNVTVSDGAINNIGDIILQP